MSIKNNTTSLQTLLEAVNALPELPILIDEGSASELLSGKQLIDQEGNIITGTFSLDNELSTQDDLIAQIQATVDNLPEAGGGSTSSDLKIAYIATIDISMCSNIAVFNQGMTWSDFCNSEYNIRYRKIDGLPQQGTFLCVHSNNTVWDTEGQGYCLADINHQWVMGSDEIIEGHVYVMHFDD